ncbi:MAG: DUF3592 domain-containing protein [Cytophagaceae bacterium]|nr:DUF3592 domain-containing protein [Cytophagaceae bacterium]
MEAFFILFLLGAITLLTAGWYRSQWRRRWLSESALTEGIVVEVRKQYDRADATGENPWYFPTVLFLANGHSFRKQAQSGTEEHLEAGEWVYVRYNPLNPREAAFGPSAAPGVSPAVLYGAGVLCVALSATFLA